MFGVKSTRAVGTSRTTVPNLGSRGQRGGGATGEISSTWSTPPEGRHTRTINHTLPSTTAGKYSHTHSTIGLKLVDDLDNFLIFVKNFVFSFSSFKSSIVNCIYIYILTSKIES